MNKQELGNSIKDELELVLEAKLTKPKTQAVVEIVFGAIAKALENGEAVDIYQFGKFEVKERAARNGVNPQTGEPITIDAVKVPKFKPAKNLKDIVK